MQVHVALYKVNMEDFKVHNIRQGGEEPLNMAP